MTTKTIMSFKTSLQMKDSIEFIAKYEEKSASQVIISALKKYLDDKKSEIEAEIYALKKCDEITNKYLEDGISYSLNDIKNGRKK